MLIGVLSVQGAFIEHINMLDKLGVSCKQIRKIDDLSTNFDGIILPGGESTVMGKLIKELGIFEKMQSMIQKGIPVFGTCAGMILLARKIENQSRAYFSTMDISVVRNAYGRQLGSFNVKSAFGNNEEIEMPFIRAPYINSVCVGVEILSVVNGKIVAAREKNQLVTAFHPELTENIFVHKYFLNMIKQKKLTQ